MYTLIMTQCTPERETFNELLREKFDVGDGGADAIVSKATMLTADGVCVIIRPEFNEFAPDGTVYFRDWVSFNGGAFIEWCWDAQLPAVVGMLSADEIECRLERHADQQLYARQQADERADAKAAECADLAHWLRTH